MRSIRFFVAALLAVNLILLGVEASKPRGHAGEQSAPTGEQALQVPQIQTATEIADTPLSAIGLECFTAGPFENRQTTELIAELLRENASNIEQRVTAAFVDRGYWVYLPPFGSDVEGHAALDALLDAGFEDIRLMESGDFNNAVSLGYFFEQDNARRRRETIAELGFQAEMTIQRQDEKRYWVDYQQQAGTEYAYRILVDIVPGELHREIRCPGGLSAESPGHSEIVGVGALRKQAGFN